MGCYASRNISRTHVGDAELYIKSMEVKLGFESISAQEVHLLLANYKPDAAVSRRVLARLLERLGMTEAERQLKAGPIQTLFSPMKEGKGYSIKRLTLLATLLSVDSTFTKAYILFDSYRQPDSPVITTAEISALISDAVQISLSSLVHWVESEALARNDTELHMKLNHYANVLYYGDEFVQNLIGRTFQRVTELTEMEFLHRVTSLPGSLLCSAVDLRRRAYQLALQKRHKLIELEVLNSA